MCFTLFKTKVQLSIQLSVKATSILKATSIFILLFSVSVQAELPGKRESAYDWFEAFKKSATDEELYRFLYAMPKGGDLHNHLSGSVRTEWFYEIALGQKKNGYRYFTKVRINNCRSYGENEFGQAPYLMMFVNLQESSWAKLDECERSEYKRLEELEETEKQGWLNSMRLDKPHEGRDEFFQTHWTRMNELYSNPYVSAETLIWNMQAFSKEGLIYLETQAGVQGHIWPDGSPVTPEEVADIHRQRLADADAKATGMNVRLQLSLLRFSPVAEENLKWLYEFVYNNLDLYVAVNMVGREDNDKGYPLRFVDTLRELRRKFHSVRLSIHAGEVDEPNGHVKDTLLLGADRIGHGVNLISDPDTMRLMRHGPYLVEINLISNLLLEYISDYEQHPFPEYLRTGIPVALSTDDRGMWDSNMTDEFFIAVKEFNLSWSEITLLSRNSLQYSFAPDAMKEEMMASLDKKLSSLESLMTKGSGKVLAEMPVSYGFICRQYQLCSIQP